MRTFRRKTTCSRLTSQDSLFAGTVDPVGRVFRFSGLNSKVMVKVRVRHSVCEVTVGGKVRFMHSFCEV